MLIDVASGKSRVIAPASAYAVYVSLQPRRPHALGRERNPRLRHLAAEQYLDDRHRLGPYEITAKLGEGGMGEVYRATDTQLKREVAIKVLPAAFTEDKERLARFEREAQLLAQLHHPNIASIFGLEETGGDETPSSWSSSRARPSPSASNRCSFPY